MGLTVFYPLPSAGKQPLADEIGLTIPARMSRQEFIALGQQLRRGQQAMLWAVSDYASLGQVRFGMTPEEIGEVIGVDPAATARLARAASLPRSRRRSGVDFAAHQLVLDLPPADQERWLNEMQHGDVSLTEAQVQIAAEREGDVPAAIPPPVIQTAPTSDNAARSARKVLLTLDDRHHQLLQRLLEAHAPDQPITPEEWVARRIEEDARRTGIDLASLGL